MTPTPWTTINVFHPVGWLEDSMALDGTGPEVEEWLFGWAFRAGYDPHFYVYEYEYTFQD